MHRPLSSAESSYEPDNEHRTILEQSVSPMSSLRPAHINNVPLVDNVSTSIMGASERGRIRDRTLEMQRRTITGVGSVRPISSSASRFRSKSPAATRTAHGIGESKLSNMQACMHVVKVSLGTGVLSMPISVKYAGLAFGTLGIFFVCWIVIHSMLMLVEVAQFVRSYFDLTDEEDVDLDYAETMDRALQIGSSQRLMRLRWLRYILNTSLIVSQIGFLSVYILFISENMLIFVEYFEPSYKPPLILYEVALCLLFIPLLMVKTLDKLAPLSVIANITGFLSLGIILQCCFSGLKSVDDLPLIESMETLPLFFGTVIFSFESINLILPIESKMKEQKALGGSFGVLTLATSIVVVFDVAIAFYGYLHFGDDIAGSISYSLPTNRWYYLMVPLLYSISIFITYALQFYVIFIIIWEKLQPRLYTPRRLWWGDIILRLSILLVTFLLATIVPHIELVISLIGSVGGSAICLIFPAFLHSIVVYSEREKRSFYILIIVKNIFIMICGVAGGVIGTFASLKEIIKAFG